jgi:DNA end-binding protein Ku
MRSAKIAMHNREHIVLIRPAEGSLILHTLYYPDELHKSTKSEAPKSKYPAKELELAKSLVNHLKARFKPQQFTDEYRENVERLIKEKQKGKTITSVEQPHKAPVIDLMEALKRSIEAGSGKNPSKGNGGRAARKTTGRGRSRSGCYRLKSRDNCSRAGS